MEATVSTAQTSPADQNAIVLLQNREFRQIIDYNDFSLATRQTLTWR